MKTHQAEVFSRATQTWVPISTYTEPRSFQQAKADCVWESIHDKGAPKSRTRIIRIDENERKIVWESPIVTPQPASDAKS